LFALLFLLFWLGNDVLVLKNGKMIRCESYERVGQQVAIKADGKKFSLPQQMVDWEKTEAAQIALDNHLVNKAKEELEAKAKAQAEAVENEEARRARIAKLMEKGIKQRERPKIIDETVDINRMGNSLIVKVNINGQGPYNFLLDTGASKTVVAPRLVQALAIPLAEETVPMMGVAGKVVHGGLAEFNSIAIGDAEVKRFPVTVFAIRQLNARNVEGLLGQDFLNFFTVELNSKTNTLRLKGQQGGSAVAGGHVGKAISADEVNQLNRDMQSVSQVLVHYSRLLGDGQQLRANQWQEIRQASQVVGTLESRLNHILAATDSSVGYHPEKARSMEIASCQRLLIPLIRELQNTARTMQSLQNQQPEHYPDKLRPSIEAWQERRSEYERCMGNGR
jgi:predicted aspartyl protease